MTPNVPVRTALIVDDFRFNRMLLRSTLVRLGYAVAEAVDAQEAFVCLERQRFHVVFLDWLLPGTRGDTVARHIREKYPDLLIIAITADTSEEMRAECFSAGVDGFLAKAFDTTSVQAMLATAPGNRENGRTSSRPPFAQAPAAAQTTASKEPRNTAAPATPPKAQQQPPPPYPAPLPAAGIRAVLANHSSQFPGGLTEALQHCRAQFDAEWQRLVQSLETGQQDRAILAAHNLGSLAGIVGAPTIHDAAHACENALRGVPAGPTVKESMAHLATVLAAIQSDLAGTTEKANA
ncbi:Hpt domain-containing response regulator [Geminisphaera colitermitum]|uniref:Hpt domain-containing response regulator n=1 Tax=Geminisphaera colitermitum TaxID=1148786 RepID=UPI000158D3BB|nr:response regulator [Geminisphaera colitermitum]